MFDVLCMLTDSPQWCKEASLSSNSTTIAISISSSSKFRAICTRMGLEAVQGVFRQLIDCLGQGGPPSDVADLAYPHSHLVHLG